MSTLELKVPPIVLGPVAALVMWPVSALTPHVATTAWIRLAAASVFLFPALLLAGLAHAELGRNQIDKDPRHPEDTRTLITSGVFALTRHPMYLGLALALCALAVGLASPLALLVVFGFVLFVHRFQVVPEERALRDKFGSAYEDYASRVREWI